MAINICMSYWCSLVIDLAVDFWRACRMACKIEFGFLNGRAGVPQRLSRPESGTRVTIRRTIRAVSSFLHLCWSDTSQNSNRTKFFLMWLTSLLLRAANLLPNYNNNSEPRLTVLLNGRSFLDSIVFSSSDSALCLPSGEFHTLITGQYWFSTAISNSKSLMGQDVCTRWATKPNLKGDKLLKIITKQLLS